MLPVIAGPPSVILPVVNATILKLPVVVLKVIPPDAVSPPPVIPPAALITPRLLKLPESTLPVVLILPVATTLDELTLSA